MASSVPPGQDNVSEAYCGDNRHAMPSPEAFIVDPLVRPRRFRVTVMGDARIDLRAELRQRRFVEVTSDHHEQVNIATHVGGTAMSFAEAAVSHFAEVRVLAAVGDDPWTSEIVNACADLGVTPCLQTLPGVANALVVVLRDARTADHPDGVRLLVAQAPAPYDQLDESAVSRFDSSIADADALVIDGYALLHESSARGLDLATRIADAAGVPVCFDLVPHRLDQHVGWPRLVPLLRRSSLVVTEAHTLARLLGVPIADPFGAQDAADLVGLLPEAVAGPRRTWFVRFGHGMMDETVAISPGHHRSYYRTGYRQSDQIAGYGYRVGAAELKWWLTNAANAPGMASVLDRLGHVSVSPELISTTPGRG